MMLFFMMTFLKLSKLLLYIILLTFLSKISLAGITSISHLDWETQQSIKMACILEKMEGPKKYDQCIRSHLSDINNSYNSDEY